jgi:hypothetical protein
MATEDCEPTLRADLRIGDAGVRQPANQVFARWRQRMALAGADSE